MADKIQETPIFGQRSTTWEDTHDGLVRILYDMLTHAFHRVNNSFPVDGSETLEGPAQLQTSTVAELTSLWPAADHPRGLLYCSNETGGATIVFSDGTDWRRVQDRAIAS